MEGAAPGERIASLDLLRGLAMVVMALDHCRDFFGGASFDPTDLEDPDPALFFTRWITHFCAPVFVLLAGTSAFLFGRGRSRASLAGFLVTRGLWLVVLEATLVHLGWFLGYGDGILIAQVIAAIGVAMVVLGALVFLPAAAVAGIGLAIVLGHDALHPIAPGDFETAAGRVAWALAHEAFTPLPPVELPLVGAQRVFVIYPWLPWIGVMACGFGLGAVVARPRAERRRFLARLGAGLVVLFVALRATGRYGEPSPWQRGEGSLVGLLSFLRTTKYPPSLAFLAMTLGPALLLLAWADRAPRAERRGSAARALATFGRVPLFFYVLHLFLGHLLAIAYFRVTEGRVIVFGLARPGAPWAGLAVVYAAWIGVVALLYPACRWYAGVKRRHRSVFLSYL